MTRFPYRHWGDWPQVCLWVLRPTWGLGFRLKCEPAHFTIHIILGPWVWGHCWQRGGADNG